jgi:hypothetical protein
MIGDWNSHAAAIWRGGAWRHLEWMILQRLLHELHGFLKLRIASTVRKPALHQSGIIDDLNVWINAVAFNTPGAVKFVKTKRRSANGTAVNKAWISADSN